MDVLVVLVAPSQRVAPISNGGEDDEGVDDEDC
jgi:hypothetical protein